VAVHWHRETDEFVRFSIIFALFTIHELKAMRVIVMTVPRSCCWCTYLSFVVSLRAAPLRYTACQNKTSYKQPEAGAYSLWYRTESVFCRSRDVVGAFLMSEWSLGSNSSNTGIFSLHTYNFFAVDSAGLTSYLLLRGDICAKALNIKI